MPTISESLAIAIEHHQNGRLQAAEQIYRQILAVDPNRADAVHLLGVIASQQGRHETAVEYIQQAIALQENSAIFHNSLGESYRALRRFADATACYRRAIALRPDYVAAHYNLGVVCQQQQLHGEASECFRRTIALKPDFADAHANLGIALKMQQKPLEAIACWQQALKLKPDVAGVDYNLGNAMREQGRVEDAVAHYRRAVALMPDYAEAHHNLGIAYKLQQKLNEAAACWRKALQLKPDFADAEFNMGNVSQEQGKLEEAIECYRRAVALKPDYAEAHNNLGIVYKIQGKHFEAAACYRRALELKPDHAQAQANLGVELEENGDMPGAEAAFRRALGHDPRLAFAHFKLAGLLGAKLPQHDMADQRRLLEEGTLPDSQRLLLHFGLAQVLAAQGAYAEAAEQLARGNALQLADWRVRGQEYDPRAYELYVSRLLSTCTAEFFERAAGLGVEDKTPVFLVGLPRSGGTLIEQILAGHSQVFAAGEIPLADESMAALGNPPHDAIEGLRRLDRPTAQRLAFAHLEKLRALHSTATRIVDKLPDNYLLLGLLSTLFPQATFIHCRRDLRDVALSCWMTHFQAVRWANDPGHIVSRFRDYARTMKHWRNVLPVPLHEVDYEATVADLEGVARRLIAACGLEWEQGCLDFYRAKRPVRTASAVQVRQAVYASSVGRWKHFEAALGPMFDQLKSLMARKGS